MTTFDPYMIDNVSGAPSYAAQEARVLSVGYALAGNGTALGTRSGVRASGTGTDLLVQAQTSPNMTVKVNPGIFVANGQTSTTQGPYTWALDTVTNITISASHATLDRTDLIVVRVRDGNVDTSGARDGSVIVITGTAGSGTPALPSDATYYTIAQISVVHAVTSITSGAITDKRTYYAALGGTINCTSTTRPTATTVAPGQKIYETDTKRRLWSDGTVWRFEPGQRLYDKLTFSTTFLSNHVAGNSITVFTSPTLNIESSQPLVIDYDFFVGSGGFTSGSCESVLFLSINSGTFTEYLAGGFQTISAGGVNTAVRRRALWLPGASDTTVAVRLAITVSGGNFDVAAAVNYPLHLWVETTGRLTSEVA